MPSDAFADVLEANQAFAATFALGGLQPVAARGLVVITCMDSRVEPLRILGLELGDAKIIRNPGGRVTPDVLDTLVLARYLLACERCMVMAHTGCKMASGDEPAVHRAVAEAGGPDTRSLAWLTSTDQVASLHEDVQRVRSSPYLPDLEVGGFLYNVHTGLVEAVC